MSEAPESQVQLVFRGEVLDGFAQADVQQQVGRLFGLEPARVAQLFSGERTVLRRSLSPAEGERYAAVLARVGARVHVEPRMERAAPPMAHPPAVDSQPLALTPVPTALPSAFAPSRRDSSFGDSRSDLHASARESFSTSRRILLEESAPSPAAPGAIGWGFEGRVGRIKFVTSNLWMLTLMYLIVYAVLQKPSSVGRIVVGALVLVVVAFLTARLSVLRCHDCNKTGWWTMLSFVPSVNAIFALVLSFAPGTGSDNDYGDEPAPSSPTFLLIAALCAALVFAMTIKAALRLTDRTASAPLEESSEPVTFDARVDQLPEDARDAFRDKYSPAREHKAFAISKSGGWGMATSAGTVRDAVRDAISECDTRRAAYTSPCTAVNVDGDWGRATQSRSRASR